MMNDDRKPVRPLRVLLALEANRRAPLCTLLHAEQRIQIVAEASLANEALFHAQARSPDAAVLDVHFPDGDGLEVVRRLKLAAPECVVILLSDPPPSLGQESSPPGAAFIFHKNTDPQQVVEALLRLALTSSPTTPAKQ